MLKDNWILRNAKEKIDKYDHVGLHYNLVANQIYGARLAEGVDPFSQSFVRYIIAGLISFDMERMMGREKYEISKDSFFIRLMSKLYKMRPLLEQVIELNIIQEDLQQYRDIIINAYEVLSDNDKDALNFNGGAHFHVGTTKILHFLNPNFFIIIDSNAARAFRKAHNVRFKNSTQPGYSSEKYVECMAFAQMDIQAYSLARFEAIDPGTPITRIYDKLTFITGGEDV